MTNESKRRGFLFDLDSIVHRGKEPIKGNVLFVQRVHNSGLPHLFITNDSNATPEETAKDLRDFGLKHVQEKDVFTSAQATESWIRSKTRSASCYVIGGEGLETALKDFNTPEADVADYVVVGKELGLDYKKIEKAISLIVHDSHPASLICTSEDVNPNEPDGILREGGVLIAAISRASRRKAVFIGKPHMIMYQEALRLLDLQPSQCCMVSDRPDTDILGAARLGLHTLLVRTGRFKPKEPYKKHWTKPTKDLDELDDVEPKSVFSEYDPPYVYELDSVEGGVELGRLRVHKEADDQDISQACVYIAIYNEERGLYVQHRHPKKSQWPDLKTTSVSGHVDPGESFVQAAVRELQEELDIDTNLTELNFVSYFDGYLHCGCLFLIRTKDEPNPSEAETRKEKCGFFSPAKLADMLKSRKDEFSPPGHRAWSIILDELKKKEVQSTPYIVSKQDRRPLIGVDFDGVIADTGVNKRQWLRREYGMELPIHQYNSSGFIAAGLTKNDYKRMLPEVCSRELTLSALPCPGAIDSLRELSKAFRLAVVSDRGTHEKWGTWSEEWLEKYGIRELFEAVHSTEYAPDSGRERTKDQICRDESIQVLVDDDRSNLSLPNEILGIQYVRKQEPKIDVSDNVHRATSWRQVIHAIFKHHNLNPPDAHYELIRVSSRIWTPPELVLFDLDGVITLENNYFEKAWALLLRRLVTGDHDLDLEGLTVGDIAEGEVFRKKTKGGIQATRIEIMQSYAKKQNPTTPVPELRTCLDWWIGAIRDQQNADFGPGNPGGRTFNDYLIDGALPLLEHLKKRSKPVYIVTANTQTQAAWIIEQLGISSLLSGVIGYPDIPTEAEKHITKTIIFKDLMSKNRVGSDQTVLIGDGYSDIRFGFKADVFTIGVYNNPRNRIKLVREKPDFLVENTRSLFQLRDLLFPIPVTVHRAFEV